jgi:hypothetical protein
VSAHTYINIYVYIMFLKNYNITKVRIQIKHPILSPM